MKNYSFLFMLLIFLQSCSVYHSGSVSAEEAVAANKKVKLITRDQQKYKFKRLVMEDDNLTGITKPGSATAKKLSETPSRQDDEVLKIDLSEVAIEKIKLRNNTLSTIINIAGPLVTAYLALLVVYASEAPIDY